MFDLLFHIAVLIGLAMPAVMAYYVRKEITVLPHNRKLLAELIVIFLVIILITMLIGLDILF